MEHPKEEFSAPSSGTLWWMACWQTHPSPTATLEVIAGIRRINLMIDKTATLIALHLMVNKVWSPDLCPSRFRSFVPRKKSGHLDQGHSAYSSLLGHDPLKSVSGRTIQYEFPGEILSSYHLLWYSHLIGTCGIHGRPTQEWVSGRWRLEPSFILPHLKKVELGTSEERSPFSRLKYSPLWWCEILSKIR